jgi:Tannase and feruloyl esterase
LTLPNVTVARTETIAAGAFTPPTTGGSQPAGGVPTVEFSSLPPFCRVVATLKPSTDSNIKIEVWMPISGWNGKFQAVGNGGWAGLISYPALAAALARGYATASTDTGHEGANGQFALGHPEKLTDFAYRAVHEMTVQAKSIMQSFYGNRPRLSYWVGCSTGGRQGLKEAQKYPADYDGIVAGAPANFWTHLMAHSIWVGQATLKDPAGMIPREKYSVIHQAVLNACDSLDGVSDGVLEDPTRCRFDPAALACKSGDAPNCLTAPQVDAARKICGALKNPRTSQEIFPGLEPGSENGWAGLAGGPAPFAIAADHFKYVVFKDPNWDFRTFDVDKGVELAESVDSGAITATETNLQPFFGHNGKLLMYHGWNDQLIAPMNSVNYYQSAVSAIGPQNAAGSVRLFMVPGMTHCRGGDGPSTFDMVTALEQWVEERKAPERVIASHVVNGTTDRTRPLCWYPQIAKYKASGSTNEAASFICATP